MSAYNNTNTGKGLGKVTIPPSYKFTSEELRALNECNKESFYTRSLPISVILGFGTYSALKNGFLKPNIRFGAVPKVSLAMLIGYCIGKISYQQKCAEKFMNLPNSYIGQVLRDRQHGQTSQSFLNESNSFNNVEENNLSIYSDNDTFNLDMFHNDNRIFKPSDGIPVYSTHTEQTSNKKPHRVNKYGDVIE